MTGIKSGFVLQAIRNLPELNAKLHEMEHIKTGARLIWLEREEKNMTFGIAFETLPWNDTGVFHILEHSVLCGSDRYPVKEPFVEMLKNSMNTFLNAMTFPDKTFYPVSSRNEKDFMNLMRVYLDAVFHPQIYSRPEIFRQEGWHYEFDENGIPNYKGVVFNEMKGAFADAEQLMEVAMNRALFPDTSYCYISGGDPAKIPDLTYEEFLESHRRCYAPSNSYLFLDGSLDIEAVLEVLDKEYLSDFEQSERLAPPAIQAPIDGGIQEVEYELPPEEKEEGRVRLGWGRVIGDFSEREKRTAMMILGEVLCGNNQSPLCKAVLSRGLAEDVNMSINDSVAQPWVKLEVNNLKMADKDEVEHIIFEELERLAREGVDHGQLEAVIANLEFRMRERDYGSMPQGLILGFQVLESWIYGGDPAANLEIGTLFSKLRKKMENGYFEQMIRDILLDNPHRCEVIQIPSHRAGDQRRQLEVDRLWEEASAWTEDERIRLMEEQRALERWQNSVDTPEALAALPCLTLADLSQEPERIPMEEKAFWGIPVLKHAISSNGIIYLSLYFDVNGCSEEDLSGLSLLCCLFGKLRTIRHTEMELTSQIQLLCGNMTFSINCYTGENSSDCCVKLCVSFSTLEENVGAALELAAEIVTETDYDNEGSVIDILKQTKTQLFQRILMNGAAVSVGRIAAQTSVAGVVEESIGGVHYYQWLKKQETGWNWAQLQKRLTMLRDKIICREKLTVSVAGSVSDDLIKSVAEKLTSLLPEQSMIIHDNVVLQPTGVRKEGIVIPADISFAAMGGNLTCPYTSELQLASRIISLGYLWNVVRVQGGAYGTGMIIRESGLAVCYSYRDPNAAQSLHTYRNAVSFLREFCEGTPDLAGFIIGTIADASPLLTPRMKGQVADSLYWRKISWERRCELRRKLLDTTADKLILLTDILEKAMEGGVCVIGSREQIDNCGGLDEIFYL